MSPPGLPHGWRSVPLEQLAAPEPNSITDGPFGSKLKTEHYTDRGPRVIRLQNIGDGVFCDEKAHISESHFASLHKHRVFPGDLLIAALGETLPRACIAPNTLGPAIVKADCIRFKANAALVSNKYLLYALISPQLRHVAASIIHGVGRPRLNQSEIKSLPIPLPARAEQDRIVAEIERQFTRLDVAIDALERLQAHLRRYRAAVLKAAVEGRLVSNVASDPDGGDLLNDVSASRRARWDACMGGKRYSEPAEPVRDALPCATPRGWAVASLEQLTDPCRPICYGILMPKENVPDGVPYVKVKDMRGDRIDVPNLHRTSPEIARAYSRASLRGGDVLLAIRGTYGRVAEVPPELDGGNITQDTARLALLQQVDRRYIAWFLRSPDAQNYFKRVARGVAVKGVNIGDVRPAPVLVPPRAVQERIVAEIERRLSDVDAVEKDVASSLTRADRLRASILRAAFEGRLVAPEQTARAPAA